jgi:hypothetical protein
MARPLALDASLFLGETFGKARRIEYLSVGKTSA